MIRHFDGVTYDPTLDRARLGKQLRSVISLMSDGKWRTLREIAEDTGAPEASVSARLRDMRKPKWGAYEVERARSVSGLWVYRVKLEPKQLSLAGVA